MIFAVLGHNRVNSGRTDGGQDAIDMCSTSLNQKHPNTVVTLPLAATNSYIFLYVLSHYRDRLSSFLATTSYSSRS